MLVESGHRDNDITTLLLEWRGGDASAFDRLFPLVYDELCRIAHRQLRRERTGHTLSTTALVHESFLRLVDQTRAQWEHRIHFFAVAACAMRRILIDHARRHRAVRRRGTQVSLDDAALLAEERAETLVALDEALTRLEALEPRLVRVVEYRFFGGLTEDETAAALGITARTVRRDWVKAKGWLRHALDE